MSRCIGVMPGVALLSEINPASVKLFSRFDPLYQDRNWIHLLEAADLERLSQLRMEETEAFRDAIATFHLRATESGRHLVLRDYSYIDFIGIPFCPNPPQKLMLYGALPAGIPTRSVALIRHPVDQWSSLRKHDLVGDVLHPAVFCDAYASFLDQLGDIPVHKYEDFVDNPPARFLHRA